MRPKRLFDTDIVIDMLEDGEHREGYISIITLIEVARGVRKEKRTKIKRLLENSFGVLELSNEVIRAYCRLYESLRGDGKALPDADLLVASTAVAHDLTLESGDGHFERLEERGLSLEAPE